MEGRSLDGSSLPFLFLFPLAPLALGLYVHGGLCVHGEGLGLLGVGWSPQSLPIGQNENMASERSGKGLQ